ncbi:MAG: F0F1 ATP synthase subunit delta [Microbacterium sp.]|uniref:F0F1 ATP synthase subunit delta n=1 Tax=Microbacterium sp. TaxID=51671 RepID=UPI003A835A33
MGSATTQALAATRTALDATPGVDLDTAGELFAVARLVGESAQLSGALADPAASVEARRGVVAEVFGSRLSDASVALVGTAAEQRWSRVQDFVDGIETLAVRATAVAAGGDDIEGELFELTRVVAANPELELALGSRLGDPSAKGKLVATILAGRASAATTLIVSSLVRQPGDRRVRQLLGQAIRIVSDQRGKSVATVTASTPLSDAQTRRLAELLGNRYGRDVSLNTVIDPTLVGGLRVQLGDDVIDGSISGRLADLRQRLAG